MSGSSNGHPQDRLSEYLDDQLGIEDRAAIDRHLASCEDCRSHLDALRRMARAIAEEPVAPLPAGLTETIGRRLDEATVTRPRRWRLALPATIAATISAVGILIAVQWREGRLTPTVQEAARQDQFGDDKKLSATAPTAPPAPASAPRSRDELVAEKPKEKTDSDAAAAGEPKDSRAVVGGLAAGREGAVEEDIGGAHENRAPALAAPKNDAPVDQAEPGRLFQKSASAASVPPPAAKAEAAATCADRWSDSGVRGTWEVPDPIATAGELNAIAREAGGIGLWRGVDDGRPYLLIVPRSRYEDVFSALRARGVAGLVDPPELSAGDDCTALSITIVLSR